MSKLIKGYIFGFCSACILFTAVSANVMNIQKTIEVVLNKVNLSVNGTILAKANDDYQLSSGEYVPNSILYKGTTYLPIRKVAELLNKEVGWLENTNTVTVNNPGLKLDDYSNALYINGEIMDLYMDAKFETSYETSGTKRTIVSYSKKFENSYFLKMYGEFSNMGNNFLAFDVISDIYPEYTDEIISKINSFEVVKYDNKIHLNYVNIMKFLKQKNINFSIEKLNEFEAAVHITPIK